MTGRVCEKHGQWCPDGACHYCESDTVADVITLPTCEGYAVPPEIAKQLKRSMEIGKPIHGEPIIYTWALRIDKPIPDDMIERIKKSWETMYKKGQP